MGYKQTTFKEWQIGRNICDCCSSVERFLTTRVRTLGLLQLILPVGWRISRAENKVKWVERDIQVKQDVLNNVYLSLRNNKVHIYNYFESDFNRDFITIRININIDEYDRISIV